MGLHDGLRQVQARQFVSDFRSGDADVAIWGAPGSRITGAVSAFIGSCFSIGASKPNSAK